MRAVRKGIASSGIEVVDVVAGRIDKQELALVHDPSYIGMIETFCSLGGGALDMDTVVSSGSWEAALRSAGAVKTAVEELRSRSDVFGFALTRPPGHHALRDHAMGFCLFNNVAVITALLRSEGERVAILDWDVHHGNGTQEIVGPDPGVLYVSIHQSPFYPFEGGVSDIDEEAKGTVINIPVPPGTAGDAYRRAWNELVIPVLVQFGADWVFVSAGYDAHSNDPLADLSLEAWDYGSMASSLAEAHPANRTVLALEGGYDLVALEDSVAATVRGLSGSAPEEDAAGHSQPAAHQAVDEAARVIRRHWNV